MAWRFVRGRLPAKKIHTLRWAGIQAFSAAQTAGAIVINILAAGAPAETILRIRGWFRTWLDGAASDPGKTILVTAGLILVPEG